MAEFDNYAPLVLCRSPWPDFNCGLALQSKNILKYALSVAGIQENEWFQADVRPVVNIAVVY